MALYCFTAFTYVKICITFYSEYKANFKIILIKTTHLDNEQVLVGTSAIELSLDAKFCLLFLSPFLKELSSQRFCSYFVVIV